MNIPDDINKRLYVAGIFQPGMDTEERKRAILRAGPKRLLGIRGVGTRMALSLLTYAGKKDITLKKLEHIYHYVENRTDLATVQAHKGPKYNEQDLQRFYKFLDQEETEIRIVQNWGLLKQYCEKNKIYYHNGSAYVKSEEEFIKTCTYLSGRVNVYVGMQQRLPKRKGDQNVARFSIVMCELDPMRPTDTSASDEQKKAAHTIMIKILEFYESVGISPSLAGDSQNGYYIYFKVTPQTINNEDERKVIQQLNANFVDFMSKKFTQLPKPGILGVECDNKIKNLERIMKALGTMGVKGQQKRLSKILQIKDPLPKEQLKKNWQAFKHIANNFERKQQRRTNTTGQPLALKDLSSLEDIYEDLRKCPAYFHILLEPETVKGDSWRPRVYLVRHLRTHYGMNSTQICNFFNRYNGWNDYNPQITKMYVEKIFDVNTAFGKVTKPVKKLTLKDLGYCLENCKHCIFDAYKKAKDDEENKVKTVMNSILEQ